MSTRSTPRPATGRQVLTSPRLVGDAGGLGPVLAVVVVLLAVGALYVGAAYALADRVPFGTTVAGTDVGGRSADDAVALLDDEVGARAERPVEVSVGADVTAFDPEQAGLGVDLPATVGSVTGFSLEPARLWRHVVGAGQVPVVTTVDTVALDAELERVAEELDMEPVDGAVSLADATPTAQAPVEGREVDVPGAAAAVRSMWLVTDGPVPLPADTLPVAITQEDVDRGLEVARAALADSLVVVAGEREVAVPPEALAGALAMEPTDAGDLALQVDGQALRAAVLAVDPEVEATPTDAQVVLSGGTPQVLPGSDGRTLPVDALAEAARTALAPDGDRRAVVEGAVVEPEVTTAEAEALGVREVVSTFSTNYPDNPDRTNNLRIAARTINGTLIQPGEVFSLNDALGERTTAKGYRAAGVISGGRLLEGVGGGVSQIATTVYNAAFFAGLEIIDFKPHSFYISRYPAGRESTLNYSPRIDMAFRNDTDTAILVQADVGGGEVTVTFWGTKVWDVESVQSPRRDATEPETVYDPSPDCTGQGSIPGFTIDTTRIWRQGGEEVKRETDTWRYLSADRVVCGPDPDPEG